MAGGVGQRGIGGFGLVGHALQHARPGAGQRRRALRLHHVHARHPAHQAPGPRAGIGLHAGAGQRAAAHLHHQVVQRRGAGTQGLQHQRLPAVDGQAVFVALAAERQRAAGQRLAEVAHAGVALLAGFARAGHHRGAQRGQAVEHGGFGIGRHVDLQGPRGGPRQHCGGQRRVAATGNGQGRLCSDAAAAPPGPPSTTARYSSRPIRWRALCEPATLCVSSLTHNSTPSRSAQGRRGAEGRDGKAVAVDPRDGIVQPLHQAHEVGIAPAPRARRMPGVQRLAPAHEGVGAVVAVEHGVVGQAVLQQVLAIALATVGAGKGVARVGGWLPAAGHADEGGSAQGALAARCGGAGVQGPPAGLHAGGLVEGRDLRHPRPAARRAGRARSPGRAGPRKSASSMPRCSTQVK